MASSNNGHNSNLHAYCVGVRSSSTPNLVPARPLRPHNAAWWSSFVTNLSSTASGRTPTARAKARAIASRCHMAATTLAHSLIWPCNNFVLSHCTHSFLVLPSLASELVKHRLSLHSSCLGTSARVSNNPINHLVHVFGHHHSPLGLLCRHSLGCDKRSHLMLHQLVDRKVANGQETQCSQWPHPSWTVAREQVKCRS